MFQSFTGSSRRPRQVNLSGQNIDPFAPSAWAPDAAGAKKTVAAAQYERQQRQQERDRLNATRNIQRAWRGYQTRKDLRSSRRLQWDSLREKHVNENAGYFAGLPDELRLLLAFFDANNPGDIERLSIFSESLLERVSAEGGVETILAIGSEHQLEMLAKCALDSLIQYVIFLSNIFDILSPDVVFCFHDAMISYADPLAQSEKCGFHQILVRLCMSLIWHCPRLMPSIVDRYYEAIRSLLDPTWDWQGYKELILGALRYPLIPRTGFPDARRLTAARSASHIRTHISNFFQSPIV